MPRIQHQLMNVQEGLMSKKRSEIIQKQQLFNND